MKSAAASSPSVTDTLQHTEEHDGSVTRTAQRVDTSSVSARSESLPEEVPVALVYNGISHAVMLATPTDLEDFALGFSLSEGILAQPSECYDCEVVEQPEGIELRLHISAERFAGLKQRRRNLTGRTGCGLCGVESLHEAIRHPAPVAAGLQVPAQAIRRAVAEMPQQQPLHRTTHAVHGAAWASRDGEILLVREDVGRHNALDKLLGALAHQGFAPGQGFVLLTSRASVEMVQKAAMLGIELLAFISAPTGLAITMAEQAWVTLVGSARNGDFSIYTHAQRILAISNAHA